MQPTDAARGDAAREAHEFEELLSKVFARFAAAEPEGVDAVISWSLGEVVDFLGGQRAGIFLYSPDKKKLDFTYHWYADGAKPALNPGEAIPAYKLDWVIEKIRGGGICVVREREKLPRDAVVYLTLLEEMNLEATVNVPLFSKSSLVGILGFGSEDKDHEWADALLSRLQLVAQVFSSALERKGIRSDLRRAEERFRVASELALDFVWEADYATGEMEVFGERLEEFSHFHDGDMPLSLDEKSWGWWREHLHPDDLDRVSAEFKVLVEQGKPMASEFRIRSADGSYRHWIERAGCLHDDDGTPLKLIGAIHDVTDQRAAAETLRRTEERFRLASELVLDMVFEIDVETERVEIFGDFEAHTGYALADTPVQTQDAAAWAWWEEHIHPDDRESVMEEFQACYRHGGSREIEFQFRMKDGSYCHWVERLTAIEDASGRVLRLVGVVSDVTELKGTVGALRMSEDLHRGILDSFPEEIVVLNREGVILSVNNTWEQFAIDNDVLSADAVSPGANYLDACRSIRDGEDSTANEAYEGITAVLEGKKSSFTMEYPCHCPRERRWFLMHAVPLRGGGSGGAVVTHTNITHLKESEEELRKAYAEIASLKERLEQENLYLREQIEVRFDHEDIVGQSAAIRNVLRQVEQVAVSEASVLIQGETGTGKELVASAIHNLSGRKEHPMVRVNCSALPVTLVESELFGREKGAYTGAVTRQTGRFELADKSTIFLDEIGELPLGLQAKLLRVLESGEFERLGSPKTLKVDVRVIAATNRDLSKEVEEGNFREDLFYRLNVFPISVPPLRERPEDIPPLVWAFIKEFNETTPKRVETVSVADVKKLQRYPWPGNVRELRNVIERAVILSDGRTLRPEMPDGKGAGGAGAGSMILEEVERRHITQVLEMSGWRVRGDGGAAQILGLNEATLRSRMKKLGIERPR